MSVSGTAGGVPIHAANHDLNSTMGRKTPNWSWPRHGARRGRVELLGDIQMELGS